MVSESRVVGINNASSEEVYVCGILFKHMKLKPQALDKYLSKKVVEKELQENRSRISDDDFLFLEDNGARIELTGEQIPVHKLVSGEALIPLLSSVICVPRYLCSCQRKKSCQWKVRSCRYLLSRFERLLQKTIVS